MNRMTSVRLAVMALVAAMMASLCAPVLATQVPAFEITSVGATFNMGGAAGLGYDFTAPGPFTIDALGTYDHLGTNLATLTGPVTVDVFQETSPGVLGSLVATQTVSATDTPTSLTGGLYTPGTDAFRYANLAVPVPLPAGNYIILSSLEGTQDWLSFVPGTAATGITFGNSVYNPSVFGSSPVIINPGNNPPPLLADFGPNFVMNAIPEPSTFVLGALATVGLIAAARRRRTR